MANEQRRGRGGAAALAGILLFSGCGEAEPDAPAEPESRAASSAAACVTRTCYADGDGDGYGTLPGVEVCTGSACPAGTAESAGDCNDANGSVRPQRLEVPNDGVDDNCDGPADEATALGPPYWVNATAAAPSERASPTAAPTDQLTSAAGTSVVFTLRLNQTSERDLAEQNLPLHGKVYYRPLADSSAPYQVTDPLRATTTWATATSAFATFTVEGLTPLTAYELRIDFYERVAAEPGQPSAHYVRIAPQGGCTGDSGDTPACSNTDVFHLIAPPAAGSDPLAVARANAARIALAERESADLGFPGFSVGANSSHFYARVAQPFWGASDPSDLRTEDDLRAKFAAHAGALMNPGAGQDLAALRPGDWLSVDGPAGPRSRLFLAFDPVADTYWFVEGDARRKTPWGPVLHAPQVASAKRCVGSARTPPGCERVRWAGKLVPAMLPPNLPSRAAVSAPAGALRSSGAGANDNRTGRAARPRGRAPTKPAPEGWPHEPIDRLRRLRSRPHRRRRPGARRRAVQQRRNRRRQQLRRHRRHWQSNQGI